MPHWLFTLWKIRLFSRFVFQVYVPSLCSNFKVNRFTLDPKKCCSICAIETVSLPKIQRSSSSRDLVHWAPCRRAQPRKIQKNLQTKNNSTSTAPVPSESLKVTHNWSDRWTRGGFSNLPLAAPLNRPTPVADRQDSCTFMYIHVIILSRYRFCNFFTALYSRTHQALTHSTRSDCKQFFSLPTRLPIEVLSFVYTHSSILCGLSSRSNFGRLCAPIPLIAMWLPILSNRLRIHLCSWPASSSKWYFWFAYLNLHTWNLHTSPCNYPDSSSIGFIEQLQNRQAN